MSVKRQRGIEIADGIKFFNQLTLQQRDYSRLSSRPNVIITVSKTEEKKKSELGEM